MPVLPIYTYGTPVLRKKAHPVKELTDGTIRLIMDMFETMHHANGIGLAATQVGAMQRVIVIDLSDMEETRDLKPIVLINPVIVSQEGLWTMEEGCLSIPDVRDEVERSEKVKVRFKNADYRDTELEATGLLGRVILHEIDHLNGVLFLDHLPAAKKKLHNPQLRKIQKGEFEVSYPVVTTAEVAV
ncbi:MAG TPA: peptide deformylase [Bacteroidota bacterium]|jgi:peptide deformylase